VVIVEGSGVQGSGVQGSGGIGHSNYLTALPQLAEHYNNTIHSRTSMRPIDLQEAETDQALNMKLKERTKNKRSSNENQFQVGDICRLRLSKADQLKSSAPFYSADVHRIIAIKHPKNPEMHPVRFKVLNVETDIPARGFFNATELLKIYAAHDPPVLLRPYCYVPRNPGARPPLERENVYRIPETRARSQARRPVIIDYVDIPARRA